MNTKFFYRSTRAIAISSMAFGGALLSSCTPMRPCDPNAPSISISRVEERHPPGSKFILPSGEYYPDFQSDKGTFYASNRRIIFGGPANFGVDRALRGGIFLPFPEESDQRQGAWIDPLGTGGGILATARQEVVRFNDPIEYNFIKNK